jgi:hypothetical protein
LKFGLDGDIDYKSFLDPSVVGNVRECQEYIFNNVKKGDPVDLIREGEKFYIFHNNKKIGKMNIENLYKNAVFYANRWRYIEKEAQVYQAVRVKNIITVAKFSDYIEDEYESPYKDTGLWVAIDLEGFGELKFQV